MLCAAMPPEHSKEVPPLRARSASEGDRTGSHLVSVHRCRNYRPVAHSRLRSVVLSIAFEIVDITALSLMHSESATQSRPVRRPRLTKSTPGPLRFITKLYRLVVRSDQLDRRCRDQPATASKSRSGNVRGRTEGVNDFAQRRTHQLPQSCRQLLSPLSPISQLSL
jgi:hypothetical protein